MHYWTDDETEYLKSLLDQYTFKQIASLFTERFPHRVWTRRMIAGRVNRLGMCKKKESVEVEIEPVAETIPDAPVLTVTTFVPTKPVGSVVVKPIKDVPDDEIVDGSQCKWPLASGLLCNQPANADGYCANHAKFVRKCAYQAVISFGD